MWLLAMIRVNIRKLSLIIKGGEVSIKNIDISNDFEINANVGDVFW